MEFFFRCSRFTTTRFHFTDIVECFYKQIQMDIQAFFPFSVRVYLLFSSIDRNPLSFILFRTGYIVPGLGFFPLLFSNFEAISAPVIFCLLISHKTRKRKKSFCCTVFHGNYYRIIDVAGFLKSLSVYRYFFMW